MKDRIGTVSTEEYVQGLNGLSGNLEKFLESLQDAGIDRVTVDERVHEIAVDTINSSTLTKGSCKCEVQW